MKEELLHFIWKYKLYHHQNLQTTCGQNIFIKNSGTHNHYGGPDFSNAQIQIGDTNWYGSVEIHINSSDWYAHKHQHDESYQAVILHVVWTDNQPIDRPTLVLEKYVAKELLEQYSTLNKSPYRLPCKDFIGHYPQFDWLFYKEALLVERLQLKSSHLVKSLVDNKNDIQQTFCEQLAYGFGLTTNSDALKRVAEIVSYKVILKYQHSIFQLEALLFGVAGFLEVEDNLQSVYAQKLAKEFQFLKQKHKLKTLPITVWNFGKIRPANAPTIRIAQFAMFLTGIEQTYSKIVTNPCSTEFKSLLNVSTSKFWNTHYNFKKESKYRVKRLGKSTIDRIIINSFLPILFLKSSTDSHITDTIFEILEDLKAEKNSITNMFEQLNIQHKSSFDSQALLHLYKNYCSQKLCMNCKIGFRILKGTI